ncbi:MAG: TIM barrel protein [Verrucomicrobiae bacterium]|nr:TIM barrel protein [Verrucomicrobiae bacterium]
MINERDIALSTNWISEGQDSGPKMLDDLRNLGVKKLELSYKLGGKLLDETLAEIDGKGMEAVSVHDICPKPDRSVCPKNPMLSSTDRGERKAAVEFARKTVDVAVASGAKAVVLHLGQVEMASGSMALLEHSGNWRDFNRYLARMHEERNRNRTPYFRAVLESLRELSDYAGSRNVSLGLENRYWIEEIPIHGEFGEIFGKIDASNMGYWHDTTHAQAVECLGGKKQEDYLRDYSGKLLGFHLSDLLGSACPAGAGEGPDRDWLGRYLRFEIDHHAPGTGCVDFAMIKKYVKDQTILVFELYKSVTPEKMAAGRDYFCKI